MHDFANRETECLLSGSLFPPPALMELELAASQILFLKHAQLVFRAMVGISTNFSRLYMRREMGMGFDSSIAESHLTSFSQASRHPSPAPLPVDPPHSRYTIGPLDLQVTAVFSTMYVPFGIELSPLYPILGRGERALPPLSGSIQATVDYDRRVGGTVRTIPRNTAVCRENQVPTTTAPRVCWHSQVGLAVQQNGPEAARDWSSP